MGFSNVAVVALLLMAFNGVCLAVVYDVGEAAGWTKNGAVDYNAWAASKKFFVGDTIVFKYKNGEKLLRVNHADFKKCDTRFPVSTYTSGHDSFLMKRATHLYYISAVYGDCMAGQKVDIKVLSSAHSAPTPSPSPAIPESPLPAPASTPNASPSPAVPDSPSVAPQLTPEATPSPAVPESPNASPSPAVPDSPSVAPPLTPEATPSPAVPESPPLAPAPRSNASPSPASATGLLSFSSLLTTLSTFLVARLITG